MNFNSTYIMYGFFGLVLFIWLSFLEWWVHSQPMHKKSYKKFPILGYLFNSHCGPEGHHSRHNYSPNHPECHDHDHEHEPILQKFWFGFFVAFLGTIPFFLLEWATSSHYYLSIICALSIYCYYWLFELVHVATHDGKHWQRTFLKKIGYFEIMHRHHIIHHTVKFNTNMTLVNQWADYLFGTKYRADVHTIFVIRMITLIAVLGFFFSYANLFR